MDKTSLDKIIQSFLLPKYKWIDEYEIQVHTYRPPLIKKGQGIYDEKYKFIYYVKPELDGTFTEEDEHEFKEIEELNHTLFKMLGPELHQWFNGVEFYVKT